jgi:hypothetical protein
VRITPAVASSDEPDPAVRADIVGNDMTNERLAMSNTVTG